VYGGQIENAVQDGLLTQAEVDVSFSPFNISSQCALKSTFFARELCQIAPSPLVRGFAAI
jgi:hypothetical protein